VKLAGHTDSVVALDFSNDGAAAPCMLAAA
jgi:hypothetical protein